MPREENAGAMRRRKKLNTLIYRGKSAGPVSATVRSEPTRARRACGCGGVRFDWGAGLALDGKTMFVEWRCNRCPRVYIEYMTHARLVELRSPKQKGGV